MTGKYGVATWLAKCGWFIFAAATAASAPTAVAADAADAVESVVPNVEVLAPQDEPLAEILIQAPEPRYVAPTRHDRIGRIWAPVLINDKGPFRMVLDTGASRSGVTAEVAASLGIVPDPSAQVLLRGVTGTAAVSTIRVDSMSVGDMYISGSNLPILADAFGGAEGILGTEGLTNRRVFIDFHNDLIIISRSHNQPAPSGFVTIPFQFERGRLLVVEVQVGSVRTKAIIDTGGQSSVANLALRDSLRRRVRERVTVDRIEGVTEAIEEGQGLIAPPIAFGPLEIRSDRLTFGDMSIFKHWHFTAKPAMLIGMDVLGLFDTMIIDYQRRELQLRLEHR